MNLVIVVNAVDMSSMSSSVRIQRGQSVDRRDREPQQSIVTGTLHCTAFVDSPLQQQQPFNSPLFMAIRVSQ